MSNLHQSCLRIERTCDDYFFSFFLSICTLLTRIFSLTHTISLTHTHTHRYKAIVVIFEAGGADSFSLLVPKDSCTTSYDMYEHYKEIRGLAAIEKSLLNTIEPESGSQVCDQFGLHGALPFVKDLFQQDEEALFFANIGGLVEPLTRDQFYDPSLNAERPPQPFAHNIAQRTMHNLEAQNANAKGVLGRTIDAMKSQSAPYKCDVYSIAGNEKMMEGMTSPVIVDRSRGTL